MPEQGWSRMYKPKWLWKKLFCVISVSHSLPGSTTWNMLPLVMSISYGSLLSPVPFPTCQGKGNVHSWGSQPSWLLSWVQECPQGPAGTDSLLSTENPEPESPRWIHWGKTKRSECRGEKEAWTKELGPSKRGPWGKEVNTVRLFY